MAALIAIVLGVIYMGIATPTEAAAFGVSGAFVLAVLLNSDELVTPLLAVLFRRTGLIHLFTKSTQETLRAAQTPSGEAVRLVVRRNPSIVQDSFVSTARTTGMIFLILLAALTLSFAFALLGISQEIAEVILSLNLSDWQLVLALVVFYLLLGTFMESFGCRTSSTARDSPGYAAQGEGRPPWDCRSQAACHRRCSGLSRAVSAPIRWVRTPTR